MPSLEKARIYEITSGDNPTTVGDPTDVQFNPESLKIQLTNRVEGGRSAGRQVRQFVGASSNTFVLDLEFDTADEGTTDEPVSVLERTQALEKFIQPRTEGDNAQEQPAKLRFHWGNLIIDGVVESMDLDFDHFAHNGYPLHAKVTLKMKEQKIEFQFAEGGDGGGGNGQRAAQALDGEMPAQAAARQCVLNGLAVAAAELGGDVDRIRRVVRVGAFIASCPGFTDQPKVANGASLLLQEIFGDAGRHARAAVGSIALPLNAPVEVELLLEVG